MERQISLPSKAAVSLRPVNRRGLLRVGGQSRAPLGHFGSRTEYSWSWSIQGAAGVVDDEK